MASLKIEVDENRMVRTLNIAGKEFTNGTVLDESGGTFTDCCMSALIERKYPDYSVDYEVAEVLDNLENLEQDELIEAVDIISRLEELPGYEMRQKEINEICNKFKCKAGMQIQFKEDSFSICMNIGCTANNQSFLKSITKENFIKALNLMYEELLQYITGDEED